MKGLLKKRLSLLMALPLAMLTLTPMQAAPNPDPDALARMAKSASSVAEHLQVAEGYLDLAQHWDQKAAHHEKLAERYRNVPAIGMAHKWPAMTNQTPDKQMKLAEKAREKADRARELAVRHRVIANETNAE